VEVAADRAVVEVAVVQMRDIGNKIDLGHR
jgi:hypothetical protein